MMVKVQPTKDVFVQFTEDQMSELNIQEGDKFSVNLLEEGKIELKKYKTIEIELGELSREVLEHMIQISCEQDISINDVVSNILKFMVENKDLLERE